MDDSLEFKPVTPLGEMPAAEAATKLSAMGEDEVAEALELAVSGLEERPSSFGPFENLLLPRRAKLYLTNVHVLGFLSDASKGENEIAISPPAMVEADDSLKNSQLVIRLDRLRAASYPGGGSHQVLFEFTSDHRTAKGLQQVRFNTTCTVREGEDAAIVGYPIFVGLGVAPEGITFDCRTVNVRNEDDLGFFAFLNGDIFKAGLTLVSTFQPALAPFGQLALAVTEAVARQGANVVVQSFRLGLDFGKTAMGARLREGTYLAVQVPPSLAAGWDWDEWIFDRHSNQIVRRGDRTAVLPYNYVAISISRHNAPLSLRRKPVDAL